MANIRIGRNAPLDARFDGSPIWFGLDGLPPESPKRGSEYTHRPASAGKSSSCLYNF